MPRVPFKGREVDAQDISFTISKEDWNEYQLHDGTIIRMRLVVSDVFRITDEYDNEGSPVYMIKSSNIMVVKALDEYKRKGS